MVENLSLLLGVSLLINMIGFFIAFWRQSDKLTDASYSLSFALLAGAAFLMSEQRPTHWLVLAMVWLWALRLGGFLLWRVVKKGRDNRFDEMRRDFWRFGRFWLMQALTVWLLMLPSLFVFLAKPNVDWWLAVGGVIWAIGLGVETVADWQKAQFARRTSNNHKWISTGLWRYSRHPNYFGEIMVWLGLYVLAIGTMSGWQPLVAALSPLCIIVLLRFISGVPILERQADTKWGDDEQYQAYKKRTPPLVPFIRSAK